MGSVTINTVRELCRPIGREGYAFDFPLETREWNPDDLKDLIGKQVYIQTREGKFDFIDKEYDGKVTITDISATKLYVMARNKHFREELVEVAFDNLQLIEWSETIVKRVALAPRRES